MRIGFFGTPSLAARVLQDLLDAPDIDVVCVTTNPDKRVGREQLLQPSPVKQQALANTLPVLCPEKIRHNTEYLDMLRSYECDYFVVVAYGKILPQELLDIPTKMCINVHGSLLPKYRGASPIQEALVQGEHITGVTIMQMSLGMDEGDILATQTIDIDPVETSETLFAKFGAVSGPTLIKTLGELEAGTIIPVPQVHTDATYCKKIEKEYGKADFTKSAKSLYHQWQGYTPWPGIYTMFKGKRLLLEKVTYQEGGTGKPGSIIRLEDEQVSIICHTGILILQQVKLEGKKSQSLDEFCRGQQDFVGSIL